MCHALPEASRHGTPVRPAEDALGGLVRRMGVRAPGSLEAFFHSYGATLMGVAMQMLGSRQDAEEVLQDALVKVWEKAPAFDPQRGTAAAWSVMLLRGLCLDRLRFRRRRLSPLPMEPDWEAPGVAAFDAGVVADVRAAWDALAAADREVLGRAIFSPATAQEMAAASGEPVGTVKARIHRALRRFFTGIHGPDVTTPEML